MTDITTDAYLARMAIAEACMMISAPHVRLRPRISGRSTALSPQTVARLGYTYGQPVMTPDEIVELVEEKR